LNNIVVYTTNVCTCLHVVLCKRALNNIVVYTTNVCSGIT